MVGMLTTSKAGHDKNHIYMILKKENEYVYLVDGNLKKLDHPKKKSIRHIQIIKKCNQKELQSMIENHTITNEVIKNTIKLYCNSNKVTE